MEAYSLLIDLQGVMIPQVTHCGAAPISLLFIVLIVDFVLAVIMVSVLFRLGLETPVCFLIVDLCIKS